MWLGRKPIMSSAAGVYPLYRGLAARLDLIAPDSPQREIPGGGFHPVRPGDPATVALRKYKEAGKKKS